MVPILEVKNLVKQYPHTRAVDGICFGIPAGTCFGLLGPNGAGKTTTIEMAEGIIAPTSGEILYKGAPRTVRFLEEIGIQFQSTALLSFLTVRESLQTFRSLYKRPAAMQTLIEQVQLHDILEKRNDKISGGQRQRLLIAIALANDPDLLFLDEPTTGLDPQARRYLWQIVETIKAQGKTIILTTHYMEEAQILCDEIAIIDQGRIIAQGAPNDLVQRHCADVAVRIPKKDLARSPDEVIADSGLDIHSVQVVTHPQAYEFHTPEVNPLLEAIMASGSDVSKMQVRAKNLEDLFLKLTGRKLRE